MTRSIRLHTATFMVVASMIGTGVFTTSGVVLGDLHSVPAVLLAWVIGGVLAIAGALSYAELVAALPENGGEYRLLSTIFHPALGFATGLVTFVVGFVAPIAATAIAFGSQVHAIWPAVPAVPAAVALILVVSTAHALAPKASLLSQDTLTVFKIVLILGVIALGVGAVSTTHLQHAERPLLETTFTSSFAVSLLYVGYAYTGWNAATYIAGEVKDPERTLPLALFLGTALVTLLYLAINVVFLGVAPASSLEGVVEVGHVAAVRILPGDAGAALSGVIAFGLVSSVGAFLVAGTRVIEAMGRDHGRLSLLARRATGGGPLVPVALQAALAIAMVLSASFDALLGYVGFTLSIFAALTVLGVIVLRIRQPDLPRPYRTFGYPVTPLLFLALMVCMVVNAVIERPVVVLAGGGTIALGLAVYGVLSGSASRRAGGVSTPRRHHAPSRDRDQSEE